MSPRRVATGADRILDRLDVDFSHTVAQVLADTAADIGRDVTTADGQITAAFSVRQVAGLWQARAPRIVSSLLRVYEQAAGWLATGMGTQLPSTWTNLTGRAQEDLPQPVQDFLRAEQATIDAIGDRLGNEARQVLAEGLDAGDTPQQLTSRLLAAFAQGGPELGPAREQRIARTEAYRAWNQAALDAAHALPDGQRPTVKQWRTRDDERVRAAHRHVNGQIQLLDDEFTVGGVRMAAPGDPTAPPELTIQCRCTLAFAPTRDDLRSEDDDNLSAADIEVTLVDELNDQRNEVVAAADGSHHQGAMIALMPSRRDAQRLAIQDGETADDLHLTLYFLGDDGTAFPDSDQASLISRLTDAAAELGGPVTGRAFGANHWNAGTDSPSWVWAVGDDRAEDRPADAPTLGLAHQAALMAVADSGTDLETLPVQHSPWVPHVCAAYSSDAGMLPQLTDRLGPVTFDRLRVAFAGDATDIPLGPPSVDYQPMGETAAPRTWSTPDSTAIAFENQETGDGRVFAPGSLFWEGGPWPLQYAEEMLSGHEGAELAGAIQSMGRDSDRITASGVLYPSQAAGADAICLLDQGAPLGISVDLDDVDIEFVDRTSPDGGLVLAASFASASMLRLDDGGWMVRATAHADFTASGSALLRTQRTIELATGINGLLPLDAVRTALSDAGVPVTVTAAAGDPDDPQRGQVVHSQSAGDVVMRVTRGRVRGATLVAMPAYSQARIVIDPPTSAPAVIRADVDLAAAAGDMLDQVVTYVCASPIPVGARHVSQALSIGVDPARRHLAAAVKAGRIVRLGRDQHVAPSTIPEGDVQAAAVGDDDHDDDAGMRELEASAWTAMRQAPPMPAAWFREPTFEELSPGSGGVHYRDGRIYGWVAQAGEPHAGMPGKNLTIESLGQLDLTHFLRARFSLDDGSTIRAGAFTMNVGHHRDGAECESASCQFDDTRTVAGIVTVGMNERGLWFSGAAAPWLAEWDRSVFAACQPSYHMKQGRDRRWQLRAVLSVPVPGHSSPLVASAVAERSNLALAASAALTEEEPALPTPAPERAEPTAAAAPGIDPAAVVQAVANDPALLDMLASALDGRQHAPTSSLAEIEQLSQRLAPARAQVATLAAQINGGK